MCGCNLCFAQTSDVEIAKELIKQAREAYDADNNSLARKLYEKKLFIYFVCNHGEHKLLFIM